MRGYRETIRTPYLAKGGFGTSVLVEDRKTHKHCVAKEDPRRSARTLFLQVP